VASIKASGGVAAPRRTAKAASVAVARVQGDKTAAAARPAPQPAAKEASHPAAKDAVKPAAKIAAKPAPTPVAARVATAEAKPPATAKPPVPPRPAVAKAATAPPAMKVGAALPSSVASAPRTDGPAVTPPARPAATSPAAASPAAASPAPAPPPGHAASHTPGHTASHTDRRPGPIDRIPPRAPSKAEIFVEGDYVVYPTHGVGKVERIAVEEIAGHRLELIHITFEENRMTLRVPVAKARSAGLRKLATRKLFDEAMAVLKGRARIKRTMWSRRAQEYEAKINSGDPLAIAEVVRDLHRNAGQPDQSFSERQIYEAAMDRLAAELAALDKTDKPTAVTKLGDFLKTV